MYTLLIQIILLTTFLYSPSDLSLGQAIYPLPPAALLIFDMLSNVTWVFGLIMLLFGICIQLNSNEQIDVIVHAKLAKLKKPINETISNTLQKISCMIAIVGIGSGFWFVSIAWILGMLLSYPLRDRIFELQKEVFDAKLL